MRSLLMFLSGIAVGASGVLLWMVWGIDPYIEEFDKRSGQ